MGTDDLHAIRRLQALMDITRLLGAEGSIQSVLDAIALVLAETVGFSGVVVNVYRPAWHDFEAATVVGRPELREHLLGATYPAERLTAVLDERFERRGAYFVPDGAVDWDAELPRFVPDRPLSGASDAWSPGDELFIPCRDSDGLMLAILSLGEPVSGRRATDSELDFLVAVGRHAALVIEQAHRAEEARRHRNALEALLAVSSKVAGKVSIQDVLQAVCDGVGDALGFQKVAIELADLETGTLSPRASVGWPAGREPRWEVPAEEIARLLEPEFEVGGCYLLPYSEARARAGYAYAELRSTMNGRGPRAWDRHWLYVPLRDASGAIVGRIWADEPADRLLPARERLEALALFAGQATLAIVSAGQLEQLRALADEDPLTGLQNRRAFMRELDAAVHRAVRYEHPLSLVIGDVDDFKLVNDTYGHPAGDAALCEVAATLRAGLRAADGAFRLGGDEFALLLPETAIAEARAVARRLGDRFAAQAGPRFAALRMSCGFAALPEDGTDAESLIRRADASLYEWKHRRGRRSA